MLIGKVKIIKMVSRLTEVQGLIAVDLLAGKVWTR